MNSFDFKFKINELTKIHTEYYDNLTELFNTIENRELNSWYDYNYSDNERHDIDWFGCKTYVDAKEIAVNGKQENLENFNNIVKLFGETNKKTKSTPGIIGQKPCVAKYLNNHPKCMIRKEYKVQKAKVISIILFTSVASKHSGESVDATAKTLFLFFKKLKDENFVFNIYVVYTKISREDDNGYTLLLKIKDYNEPLSNRVLALSCGYASTARKIVFRWYESFPNSKRISGYGCPLNYILKKDEIINFCKQLHIYNDSIVLIAENIINNDYSVEELYENALQNRIV